MKLEILSDRQIENPNEEDIVTAVTRVYAEKVDAVILLSDEKNNRFMQVPCGGEHIEYCVGPQGPIYAVEGISLDQAIRLFVAYARGEDSWKTEVPWEIFMDRI